ncbi:MAG: trypsin-like peptidase domain-containing protein, partial [Chloroflexi bacterium]|nr:trypsin-like peptidase domain-containing protein [Chloroflexota bacterium]
VIVSLACGGSTTPTVEPQPPTKVPDSVPADKADEPEQPTVAVAPASGAVSNVQDVKGAVIQIEAQGSFVDPEFGLMSGAGRGSGFIIDPSGIAVTNNHVVTGAALLKVWVGGDTSRTYNARILGVSECSDLAVIDIEGDGFPYLEWHSGSINVGLDVYTAGFPLGDPEYTLTKGIVSKEKAGGETNWASIDSVIEHDATINPGNSGGPLVDTDGKVVGINYASYKAANQYFAISRDVAIPIIEKLKAGQDIDSLGVNGVAVVSDDGTLSGIWVSSVKSGSPVDKTGLTGGDIITALEGLNLATDGTMADYCDIIRTHGPQATLAIEVLRYDTEEVLEGQINGQALAQSYSFADTLEEQVDTTTDGGEAYSDYVTIYDDTGAITIDVPAAWGEVNGSLWEADWDSVHFVAADIQAAPDLDAFGSYYAASGVDFAASKDWGQIGGYVQLLDGTRHWYEDNCDLDGRYDYEDEFYEGKYDMWTCGVDATVIVLSTRPISDPGAYLTLVQVQLVTDADIDALGQIMKTFYVVGNLP